MPLHRRRAHPRPFHRGGFIGGHDALLQRPPQRGLQLPAAKHLRRQGAPVEPAAALAVPINGDGGFDNPFAVRPLQGIRHPQPKHGAAAVGTGRGHQPFVHAKLTAVSRGGAERAHTVLNALEQLLRDHAAADDWAMVHDAARPCLRLADIERLVAAARAHGGGAVLGLRVADTLKRANREGVIETTVAVDRDGGEGEGSGGFYWRALTPQMFRCGQLQTALRRALEQGVVPTDESAAMERAGMRPAAVEGHPANLKITVPADLELAALYLQDAGKGASSPP